MDIDLKENVGKYNKFSGCIKRNSVRSIRTEMNTVSKEAYYLKHGCESCVLQIQDDKRQEETQASVKRSLF
jgi:hypothetical protein